MRFLAAFLCFAPAVLLFGADGSMSAVPDKNQICLSGTKHSHSAIAGRCSRAFESSNYSTALREWKLLANEGNRNAQYNLGQMYVKGQGVPLNYKTARKWFELAAKQGFAPAQHNMGVMYEYGDGGSQNYSTAAQWYELAAEQGTAYAQTNLGVLYLDGQGVPQNHATALKWFELAAEQGALHAQANLGHMYERGNGVSQSYKTALKWYKLAAEQGDVDSQRAVARLLMIVPDQEPGDVAVAGKSPTPGAEKKPNNIASVQSQTLSFPKGSVRPDDVAVIIANSNYEKQGIGIPNVTPAYTDANNIKQYFTQALGIREGNIIYLEDATGSQLTSVFGSKEDHKGKLFNWTKPDISKVYVYYAGHGAPAGKKATAYLVPSDADSDSVQLTGYPLKQLYDNLQKIPAKSITVILEACFSGQSQTGYLLSKASAISVTPKLPDVPTEITVISAGAADQVASWEEDESQSLFTKYFLKAMSGEGDKEPYGNGDGTVSLKELQKYLDGDMTYYARRHYGRDQTAQIIVNGQDISAQN